MESTFSIPVFSYRVTQSLHFLAGKLLGSLLIAQHVDILAIEERVLGALVVLGALDDALRIRRDLHHRVVFAAHGVRDHASESLRACCAGQKSTDCEEGS